MFERVESQEPVVVANPRQRGETAIFEDGPELRRSLSNLFRPVSHHDAVRLLGQIELVTKLRTYKFYPALPSHYSLSGEFELQPGPPHVLLHDG